MRATLLILVALSGHLALADDATLLDDITGKGVAILDDQTCVLPKPSLQPGLDAAARKEVLDDLAGGRGWKHFSRKSISAPVAIKVQYVKDANGERIGHQVHSVFVAHASLETLKNAELMEQMFLQPESSNEESEDFSASELEPAELKAAGIEAVAEHESYRLVELPLLKKVIVRGVMRSQRLVSDDSVTLVWEIDPRFTGDATNRNTWASVSTDDSETLVEGEKQPYRGAGGYMHISELSELENACLVESYFVLHEPSEWFRGSAMLRSKLPLLLQDSAKKFRRKLMDK